MPSLCHRSTILRIPFHPFRCFVDLYYYLRRKNNQSKPSYTKHCALISAHMSESGWWFRIAYVLLSSKPASLGTIFTQVWMTVAFHSLFTIRTTHTHTHTHTHLVACVINQIFIFRLLFSTCSWRLYSCFDFLWDCLLQIGDLKKCRVGLPCTCSWFQHLQLWNHLSAPNWLNNLQLWAMQKHNTKQSRKWAQDLPDSLFFEV